jgi:hypothetical protein
MYTIKIHGMEKYTAWKNTRHGKIHGMEKYTAWKNTRHGEA